MQQPMHDCTACCLLDMPSASHAVLQQVARKPQPFIRPCSTSLRSCQRCLRPNRRPAFKAMRHSCSICCRTWTTIFHLLCLGMGHMRPGIMLEAGAGEPLLQTKLRETTIRLQACRMCHRRMHRRLDEGAVKAWGQSTLLTSRC